MKTNKLSQLVKVVLRVGRSITADLAKAFKGIVHKVEVSQPMEMLMLAERDFYMKSKVKSLKSKVRLTGRKQVRPIIRNFRLQTPDLRLYQPP